MIRKMDAINVYLVYWNDGEKDLYHTIYNSSNVDRVHWNYVPFILKLSIN